MTGGQLETQQPIKSRGLSEQARSSPLLWCGQTNRYIKPSLGLDRPALTSNLCNKLCTLQAIDYVCSRPKAVLCRSINECLNPWLSGSSSATTSFWLHLRPPIRKAAESCNWAYCYSINQLYAFIPTADNKIDRLRDMTTHCLNTRSLCLKSPSELECGSILLMKYR